MQTEYKYDAFISHAVEDKIPIANELCNRLEAAGLKIWYSGKELGPGDHISQTIEEGLRKSRFGVVIFTQTYIQKAYALKELFDLLDIEKSMEKSGRKMILPVLHEISPPEIAAKGLEMENRFQISTAKGLDYVIDKLVNEIHKTPPTPIIDKTNGSKKPKWIIGSLIGIFVVLFTSLGIYQQWYANDSSLEETFIKETIMERIQNLNRMIENDYKLAMTSNSGRIVDSKTIEEMYTNFQSFKSHYRNTYELNNGDKTIVSKKNVDAALNVDLETFTPFNSYSFTDPVISLVYDKSSSSGRSVQYTYTSSQPVEYSFTKEKLDDDTYIVIVTYSNKLRYFKVDLSFPDSQNGMKRHHMFLISLLPIEQYEFGKTDGAWQLVGVK